MPRAEDDREELVQPHWFGRDTTERGLDSPVPFRRPLRCIPCGAGLRQKVHRITKSVNALPRSAAAARYPLRGSNTFHMRSLILRPHHAKYHPIPVAVSTHAGTPITRVLLTMAVYISNAALVQIPHNHRYAQTLDGGELRRIVC